MRAREAALLALYEVDGKGAFSEQALKKVLPRVTENPDKGLATELVYGVIRHRSRLDCSVKKYSSQRLSKLSVFILNLLRMGMYQLFFLDRIPPHAVVSEATQLAKRYGHRASAGFVNAVLRAAAGAGEAKCPSIADFYSHPAWLAELLEKQYPADFKEIMKANNTPAPVTVRVNPLRTGAAALTRLFEEQGIKAAQSPLAPNLLDLSGVGDIASLPAFREGLFTVQDGAAYLAAHALGARPGELIMDVCAAPGGKATQLGEQSGDKAGVVAFDLYPHKIELIEKNAARLRLGSIRAMVHDAREAHPSYIGKADGVLADVPCSGLGIIRKKPDIKWTKTPADLVEIKKAQEEILRASSCYVKPGGRLVYSTCTVNHEENSGIVDEFLKTAPFQKVRERQYLPHLDGCDGFYVCALVRG